MQDDYIAGNLHFGRAIGDSRDLPDAVVSGVGDINRAIQRHFDPGRAVPDGSLSETAVPGESGLSGPGNCGDPAGIGFESKYALVVRVGDEQRSVGGEGKAGRISPDRGIGNGLDHRVAAGIGVPDAPYAVVAGIGDINGTVGPDRDSQGCIQPGAHSRAAIAVEAGDAVARDSHDHAGSGDPAYAVVSGIADVQISGPVKGRERRRTETDGYWWAEIAGVARLPVPCEGTNCIPGDGTNSVISAIDDI